MGTITINNWCFFYLVHTQLKPQDITGGLLAGYVADRHRAIYGQRAQRPKQAVSQEAGLM